MIKQPERAVGERMGINELQQKRKEQSQGRKKGRKQGWEQVASQ